MVEDATGRKPKVYQDLRKLYEDKDIDAVSIATPNHWHALATIWACQAGKDVYCEKPAAYNMFEGQQMVAAARKYNRMVQIGMQSRSIPHKRKAVDCCRLGRSASSTWPRVFATNDGPQLGIRRRSPFLPG